VASSSAASPLKGTGAPLPSLSDVKSRMFGSSIGSRRLMKRLRGKLDVDSPVIAVYECLGASPYAIRSSL
jgi:hypothetical protein